MLNISYVLSIYGNQGFPSGSDGKESACNAGDPGLTPGLQDLLEKGKATHSSILAWRIPWTEEPGGLQSMWSESDTTKQLILSLMVTFNRMTYIATVPKMLLLYELSL